MSENQPPNLNLPVPVTPAHIATIETSIASFYSPLAGHLAALSLPVEDVFVPAEERLIVLKGFEMAINSLPPEERGNAFYLSKFMVASTVGLFDSAINYMWNETIQALRKLVVDTDLAYFFDIAEKRENYRSKLKDPDDLAKIEDYTLIETCSRIGLINDVNKERLLHINYMRNHASAAHPNQSDLNGQELLGWLTNCIRYAITAKPDMSVINVKRLLRNIKDVDIPLTDVPVIGGDVCRLPQARIDDLVWTLFGMYTDLTNDERSRGNIAKIIPHIWPGVTEARRYEVGSRLGYFLKHGEQGRKDAANDFLNRVDGLRYRSEDMLTIELMDKLHTLHQAHIGWNNFYNEWPHAAALSASLPNSGIVPRAARRQWVKIICMCYIGNGKGIRQGVDDNAVPYYQGFINAFGEAEVVELLQLFTDDDFTVDLDQLKPDARARMLLSQLKTRMPNVLVKQAIDVILAQPSPFLRKVGITTAYKTAIKNLPNHP